MAELDPKQFVQQTLFGKPYGNCFSACVASVVGRPIEGVPNFNLWGDHWEAAAQFWCSLAGWQLSGMINPSAIAVVVSSREAVLATGRSPRGLLHTVLWTPAGGLLHDPHPEGGGIELLDGFWTLRRVDPMTLTGMDPEGDPGDGRTVGWQKAVVREAKEAQARPCSICSEKLYADPEIPTCHFCGEDVCMNCFSVGKCCPGSENEAKENGQ